MLADTLDIMKKKEDRKEPVDAKLKADVTSALNDAKGKAGTAAGR